MWDFKFDREHGVLRMTLSGFFSRADVDRFDTARRAALAKLGCGPNRHLTLCDVADCQLSTPEVVAALQAVIGDPRYRSRRCAMVVPGALARMQARRAVRRDDVAMFDARPAAEAWLLDPGAIRSAAGDTACG